jgi:lysophospholipase L1-like esterase
MSHKQNTTDASKLDPNMRAAEKDAAALAWHDPGYRPFQLAGFPWFARDRAYRRLPLRPPEPIPEPVSALANCAAGGQIRFQTDSTRVAVRVTLLGPAGMVHMPATGECGCDLYVHVAGRPRYYGTTKYDLTRTAYEITMFEHAHRTMRAFTLYLPLYKGIREIHIGLSPDAIITAPPPYADGGRIVAYGTSITQGGCASRPGMAYTNILARLLNREVTNLGFSGNGRGEPAVARLVADVPDPRLFLIDYDPNCPSVEHIAQTLPTFLQILRERHAQVPILVMSRISYGHDLTQEAQLAERLRRRDLQARIVAERQAQGDRNLHFLDGGTLLGEDFEECTVDQVHPTDLGFYRIAKGLEPVVAGILGH